MLPRDVPLYFIRHGETDWNAAKRYQGQTDIPLNDTGRGQAARNGQALKAALGVADIYDFVASPLARTSETMQIVRREMGLHIPGYRTDDRLKEIHFGHWEGQVWYDLPNQDGEAFALRLADPWGWQPRGGESYAMLSDRVAGWLADVRQPTVVVSHGGVSRVLRGLITGKSGRAVTDLEVPQDRVLLALNGELSWL